MESNEWTRDQLWGRKGGTVPEQCGISPKAGPCQDDWAWTESSAGSVPAVIWLCHFTFVSLGFFSWTQGEGPHLFTHQGQCEKRWEQVSKSGVCEGRWGWEVPGTLVWGQSQTWMRAPILWLCPPWKQLPIASHRHSGWKKVVIQARQVYQLRWCHVVIPRGGAGGRLACELCDRPFLIRQKEC